MIPTVFSCALITKITISALSLFFFVLPSHLELLDLFEQDLGLSLGEVRSDGLQDAVERLGHGGLQVSRVHLGAQVVSLQGLVGAVHHWALMHSKSKADDAEKEEKTMRNEK